MEHLHIICTSKLVQSVKEKVTKGNKITAILYAVKKHLKGAYKPLFHAVLQFPFISLVHYVIVCLFKQRGQHANSYKGSADKQRGIADPQS